MKTLCSSLIVAGLLVLTGCNTSPTGGGNPGGHPTSPTPNKGPTGHAATFKLKGAPETSHTLKRNANEDFKIKVDKGQDFKEDLSFTATVDPADKGVTATVEPKTLKASDPPEVKVTVTAQEKVADGAYRVTLQARPAKGEPTQASWDVKVPAAK
jgi:hypothetical protein